MFHGMVIWNLVVVVAVAVVAVDLAVVESNDERIKGILLHSSKHRSSTRTHHSIPINTNQYHTHTS